MTATGRFFTAATFLLSAVIAAFVSSPALASLEKVEMFIHEGMPFFASRIAPSKLRQIKGLLREEKSIVPNNYEPTQNDTHHTFVYRGFEVWLICPPNTSTECLIAQVSLTRPGYRVKFSLGVGTNTSTLLKVLGEPTKRENGEWIYSGESSTVAFAILNNRVKAVRWDMYTG